MVFRVMGKHHPQRYFKIILMQEPVTQHLIWFPSVENEGQKNIPTNY